MKLKENCNDNMPTQLLWMHKEVFNLYFLKGAFLSKLICDIDKDDRAESLVVVPTSAHRENRREPFAYS